MSNYAFMLDKSSCDPKDRLMMSWYVRQSISHTALLNRSRLNPHTYQSVYST